MISMIDLGLRKIKIVVLFGYPRKVTLEVLVGTGKYQHFFTNYARKLAKVTKGKKIKEEL